MSLDGVYRPRDTEAVANDNGAYRNRAFDEGDIDQGNSPNDGVPPDRAGVRSTPTQATADEGEELSPQERMWKEIYVITDPTWEAVKARRKAIYAGLLVFFTIIYCICLVYACFRSVSDATVMLVLTGLVILALIYKVVRDKFGESISEALFQPAAKVLEKLGPRFTWFMAAVIMIAAIIVVIVLCRNNPRQLTSATGLFVFILVMYITSKSPQKVKWRPVLWGLLLQFLLGLFILRTQIGFDVFNWLGDVVQTFLNFSDEGAKFVFGDPQYLDHFFAFKVLPVVIYFSCFISILYHWGVMQVIIKKIAWLMQKTMKTSASESLNAAGNIFIGQTEAPLLIRPMLTDMTMSELHAVMTGGFATIAGSVLGAFIAFGISASHLLSASVMSAPAALAVSKLFYPETEKSKHVEMEDIELSKGNFRNVVEAASHGAITAIQLALNIAGNLIAFIAILALLNGILGYLGGLIGCPGHFFGLIGWECGVLSFEYICSYLFVPLALLMGVEPKDCRMVAELVGLKTFLNEFVAYARLSEYIQNRQNNEGDYMSIRSEIIATYALCGFSNISSIGIQLGGLTPMAPSRASDLASVAIRALIAGSVACFMTACIAGLLYDESNYEAVVLAPSNQTA